MTIESTNDNNSTKPAITYSECYVNPLRGYRLQQHNKSDLEYLQEWIDLKTSKSDETATMVIEKITDMLKQKKRYIKRSSVCHKVAHNTKTNTGRVKNNNLSI